MRWENRRIRQMSSLEINVIARRLASVDDMVTILLLVAFQ